MACWFDKNLLLNLTYKKFFVIQIWVKPLLPLRVTIGLGPAADAWDRVLTIFRNLISALHLFSRRTELQFFRLVFPNIIFGVLSTGRNRIHAIAKNDVVDNISTLHAA